MLRPSEGTVHTQGCSDGFSAFSRLHFSLLHAHSSRTFFRSRFFSFSGVVSGRPRYGALDKSNASNSPLFRWTAVKHVSPHTVLPNEKFSLGVLDARKASVADDTQCDAAGRLSHNVLAVHESRGAHGHRPQEIRRGKRAIGESRSFKVHR